MARPSCISSNRDPDESLSVELNPSSEDTVLAKYIHGPVQHGLSYWSQCNGQCVPIIPTQIDFGQAVVGNDTMHCLSTSHPTTDTVPLV